VQAGAQQPLCAACCGGSPSPRTSPVVQHPWEQDWGTQGDRGVPAAAGGQAEQRSSVQGGGLCQAPREPACPRRGWQCPSHHPKHHQRGAGTADTGGWVLGHPLQPPPGQRPGRPGSTGGCSPLGHQRYAGHIQTQLIVNEQQSSSGRNFQLSEKLYRPVIKKWLLKKLERKKISSVVGLSSRICRNRFVRAG